MDDDSNQDQHDPVEVATPPIQEVTDLDTFVKLLASWHAKRVHRLESLMMTPEGTVVTFNEETNFELSGEKLKAFRFGVAMALTQLGHLPFEVEFTDSLNESKPH
jgi:hypothetical protein